MELKNHRSIITMDKDTGEVLRQASWILVPERKKNAFDRGEWFAMANYALKALKQMKNLDDHRVIIALMERLDYENEILVSQVEIAQDLGMHKQNVNKSIKRLVEMEAIFEGQKHGRSRSYTLNPYFGWKGSPENHKKAIQALERRKTQAGITKVIEGGLAKLNDPYTANLLD